MSRLLATRPRTRPNPFAYHDVWVLSHTPEVKHGQLTRTPCFQHRRAVQYCRAKHIAPSEPRKDETSFVCRYVTEHNVPNHRKVHVHVTGESFITRQFHSNKPPNSSSTSYATAHWLRFLSASVYSFSKCMICAVMGLHTRTRKGDKQASRPGGCCLLDASTKL